MALHKPAFDDNGGDGAARLGRALRRFAMAGQQRRQRRLSPLPNHDEVLRWLLAEMDETVLPRQFELNSDTGEKMALTVSNRRLLSFSGVGEGTRTAANPVEFADQAMGRLRAMLEHASSVTLDVIPGAPSATAASRLSCSVPLLAEAAGLSALDRQEITTVGGFIETVKELAHAWFQFNPPEGEPAGAGPHHLIERLKTVGRQIQGDGGPVLQESQFRLHEPNCLLLPMDDERMLVIAAIGGTRLMALLPAQERQAILDSWQRAMT